MLDRSALSHKAREGTSCPQFDATSHIYVKQGPLTLIVNEAFEELRLETGWQLSVQLTQGRRLRHRSEKVGRSLGQIRYLPSPEEP